MLGILIGLVEHNNTGVLYLPWTFDFGHIVSIFLLDFTCDKNSIKLNVHFFKLFSILYFLTFLYDRTLWWIDLNPVVNMKFIDFLKFFIYSQYFDLSFTSIFCVKIQKI